MIRILELYEPESYYNSINDGNVEIFDHINILNSGCLETYTVGDKYCNCEIESIYYHDTSDSAWMVVRTDDNGYFEVSIDGTRQYN